MSGHSKWSQVKHKKALTDAKKGQAFSKMVREITIAAKTGGSSPDSNARLRSAIERAKSIGLPKENVERAISKASGVDSENALQEFVYEASAPGGIAIIIEGTTNNKNRTLSEIKHLLSECGGKLAEQGSLLWNFKKVGIIEIAGDTDSKKTADETELALIEAGAEDLKQNGSGWLVETEFTRLEKVRRNLEERGFKINGVLHYYKPGAVVELTGNTKEKIEKLLDKLALHDDVQEIYTNLTTHDTRNMTHET